MRRRAAVVALTALAVAQAGPALAGQITPSPKKIGASTAAVSSCGSLSGIGISWTSTANAVTTVVLSSVPALCNGDTLSLALVDSTGVALATIAPTTITGTTQTFTSFTGSATATLVTGAQISVAGP